MFNLDFSVMMIFEVVTIDKNGLT